MTSITTITQKGQITLPIAMRRALGWSVYDRVEVKMGDGGVEVAPVIDIMSLGGTIKPIKGRSVMKARAYMEKHYKRI